MVDKNGEFSPLELRRTGKPEISLAEVTKLLNSRAEPNEYDRLGETPLFAAASQGQPDVVATRPECQTLDATPVGRVCLDRAGPVVS